MMATSEPTRGPSTSVAAPRFVFVDFLRGVAALLVAYFHLQIHGIWHFPVQSIPPSSFTYRFVSGNFGLGIFGVALFFMISGFLIPATLQRRGPDVLTVRRFAIHRFFRLYPVFWLSMLWAMLTAYVGSGGVFPMPQVLANATMLQGYMGQPDMVGVYWTLQIELTFYVVCVVLFALRQLERKEAILYLFLGASLACAALRFWAGRRLPVALFLGPSVMFLGDVVRRARDDASLRRRVPMNVALVLVALLPICWLAYADQWRCYALSYSVAIAAFFLAYRFAAGFEKNRALRAVSVWLGETSYVVYLFHALIAPLVMEYLIKRGVEKELSLGLSLAVCLAFSTVIHRLVEQPFITLGRRLTAAPRPSLEARPAVADDST